MKRKEESKGSWKNLMLIVAMIALALTLCSGASAAISSTRINFNIYSDPAIFLNSPLNDSIFGTSYVSFNYSVTDYDGHTSDCTLYSDSSPNPTTAVDSQNVSSGSTISYNHTGLSNGTYYWKVNCTDTGGNSNESEVRVYSIDLIPPTVNESETLPPADTLYNQTDTILLTVSVDENLTTATANVTYPNGTTQLINLTYNGTEWYYSGTFTDTLAIGTYNITYNVTDLLSNSNTTTTNFTISDITSPSVTSITPTAGTSYAVGTSVTITADVADPYENNVGTVLANVTWDSSYETLVMTDTDSDGTYNATFTNTTQPYTYTVTIIANDTSNNLNNTETTNFSTTDNTNPVLENISISPRVVIRGRNVTIDAQAADNIAIDGIFANITLPNGTVRLVSLPAQYTAEFNERNNITIFANDTSGNLNYTTDHFIVRDPINITITVFDSNSSSITTNLTIYLNGTTEVIDTQQIIGNITTEQASYTYDLLFDSYDSNITLLLRGIELPLDDNETLGIESLDTAVEGYIVTYGVNTTFNFTSARVRISYSGLNYTTEGNLVLDRCANWSFLNNTCLGTWEEQTTAIQDTGADTFTVNATAFSAFSIREVSAAVSGGGHGGSGGYTPPKEELPPEECRSDWICTPWSECTPDNVKTRMCADWNSCENETFHPITEKGCTFIYPSIEVKPPEVPVIEMPLEFKVKKIATTFLFIAILLGALFALFTAWKQTMYPPEMEHIEFIELETMLPIDEEKEVHVIRKFEVETVTDFKEIIHFARHGPTVSLVNTNRMKHDLKELKRGVRLLKKTVKATDGDIAGLRDSWIVATSFGITIHKGDFVKEMKKEEKKGRKKK